MNATKLNKKAQLFLIFLHLLRQNRVSNARPATQVMIDTYMAALGFTKTNHEGCYTNGTYEAWDLLPRNVLVDDEGDLYVVDAEIRKLL